MNKLNPLACDNKLVAYNSWFASPILYLLPDSRTHVRNGVTPLMLIWYLYFDLPKHVMRDVSKFACVHIVSQWNLPLTQ